MSMLNKQDTVGVKQIFLKSICTVQETIKRTQIILAKCVLQCGGSMLSGNMASEMYQEEMQQVKYLKEMWPHVSRVTEASQILEEDVNRKMFDRSSASWPPRIQ
jgi:hypothetical protein